MARLKQFPIKFYKKEDGSIYYENAFLKGTDKNITNVFDKFRDDFDWDLLYYYNDIQDVEFGRFEPALKDKKYKGMTYLGKLNLALEINDVQGENTVKHLKQHPEDIEKQTKFIQDQKFQLKKQKFIQKIKDGISNAVKRVAGLFKNEMFQPLKTRQDLICDHCGGIIPATTYYENFRGKNYHIECIWCSFSDNPSTDYDECRDYFFSLEKFIGHWPANLEVEDDYVADLELVKSNDRRIKLV